jgi:hypothetical protein
MLNRIRAKLMGDSTPAARTTSPGKVAINERYAAVAR